MQEEVGLGVNVKVTSGYIHGRGLVLVHVFGASGESGVDPCLFLDRQSYGPFGGAHSGDAGIVLGAGVVGVQRFQVPETAGLCGAKVDVEGVATWVKAVNSLVTCNDT